MWFSVAEGNIRLLCFSKGKMFPVDILIQRESGWLL